MLSRRAISENGDTVRVTATLNRASTAQTRITVGETSPAVRQTGGTLTIAANSTTSSGTVTLTGVNDRVFTGNRFVTVRGRATNTAGVSGPADVTLVVHDDETEAQITDRDQSSAEGRNYSELVTRVADGLAFCVAEAKANASRSSGTWGYGNPYTDEVYDEFTRRVATKIVSNGQCQITYTVIDEFIGGVWRPHRLTISVIRFDGAAPPAPAPPEGSGHKREDCSPAQAKFHPHLCLSVETEESQTQCIGSAAEMAPGLCEGAEIVDRPEPGEPGAEFANGSSSAVQRWLEQERIKEENKRRHDAECAANPSEPCPPYPYERWAYERWARQQSD